MPQKPYLEAGQIVGTHGVRGEVRLQPWCDSPAVLTPIKTLYFDEGKRAVKAACRPHKNLALVKLAGVDTVEAAAALRGDGVVFKPQRCKTGKRSLFYLRSDRADRGGRRYGRNVRHLL